MLDTSPPTLTEADALKIVVSATGGTACAVHEVGVVANHLRGPLAALRPYGHPDYNENRASTRRSKYAVDSLIADAIGSSAISCTCGGEFAHPLAVVISEGAFIRAHVNSAYSQRDLDQAVASADIDRLLHAAEPRLAAVVALFDRARAEHGGNLPDPLEVAAAPLVHSLAGPRRWNVRDGYHDGWNWSTAWRPGVVFDNADRFMTHTEIADATMRRIVQGNL